MNNDILKLDPSCSFPVSEDELKKRDKFIEAICEAAQHLNADSRATSIVKTKLEEAVMWYNKGLFRGS